MQTLTLILTIALIASLLFTGYTVWDIAYRTRPAPKLPALKTGER